MLKAKRRRKLCQGPEACSVGLPGFCGRQDARASACTWHFPADYAGRQRTLARRSLIASGSDARPVPCSPGWLEALAWRRARSLRSAARLHKVRQVVQLTGRDAESLLRRCSGG